MFCVPIGSDAPVYYFPWGTIGLIAANVLVQLGISLGVLPPIDALAFQYALVHGDGLHPLQWITSNFLHAGWEHLLGNMVFLWAFGLIVEGKIGWRRFLLVYLGIGAAECLIEQLFLPGPGSSLGASSIIFGLMMMALVWAPQNEIEIWYLWGAPMLVRSGTFQIAVVWLSLLMVAKEVLFAAIFSFSIGSQLFHLMGAVLGFGIGVSMLKAKLVDCEGWDLWSVWNKTQANHALLLRAESPIEDGRSRELAALTAEQEAKKREDRRRRSLRRITTLVQERRAAAALAELRKTQQLVTDFQLRERELLQLATALYDAEQWRTAVELFDEFIERFPQRADLIRLLSADVMVRQQQRPTAALRHLQHIRREKLPPAHHRLYDDTQAAAERMVDEGVIELEGRSWN